MRVICIEGGNISGQILFGGEVYPKEGETYTAYQHHYYDDCYDLEEMPPNSRGTRVGYQKKRFATLSSIDETELIKEREEIISLTQ